MNYQSSSHWRKLITDKYGRNPIKDLNNPDREYEDKEFTRSLMYENGEMTYVVNVKSSRNPNAIKSGVQAQKVGPAMGED